MNSRVPPFRSENVQFAYQLHYHLGFRTRRRAAVFCDSRRREALQETLAGICLRNDYHLLEWEVGDRWVRLLLSLRPSHSPAVVMRTIKCNSSRFLLQTYPEIVGQLGVRSIWSRAYYVRGVGDVTNECVHQYVARQRQRHERNSHELATFVNPAPDRFFDLRPWSHCVAEYNCHLVINPLHHVPAIDGSLAGELLDYVRRIIASKKDELISAAVLDDHIHLLVALNPVQSPCDLTLAVLNNTWYWICRRNPGALKLWDAPDFWAHSAFVRTAGAATTNQVRCHLRDLAALED